MKSWILAFALAVVSASLLPTVADAKRIGGGSSAGMQRSLPSRGTPDSAAPRPAAPAAVPAPAGIPPTPAPRRSWMGPIAGLAAGLGIAALMSHFGMGGELGNIVTMLLIAAVGFIAIRFLMRRFMPGAQGIQYARAGAQAQPASSATVLPYPGSGPGAPPPTLAAAAPAPRLPPGFDLAAFERIAKLIFIRLQAANDSADLNDLRAFTTPEMFAAIKLDLQDRGAQQTDVVRIDAEVLDFATEAERQIVSVRFHGLIREERDAPAAPFDEVWHLVKPGDDSREWAIAGIQQTA